MQSEPQNRRRKIEAYFVIRRDQHAGGRLVADKACLRRIVGDAPEMPDVGQGHDIQKEIPDEESLRPAFFVLVS